MNKRELYKQKAEEHNMYYDYYDVLTSDDLRHLRAEMKEKIKEYGGEKICDRAFVINYNGGYLLVSYWTNVAFIYRNKFYKLWHGYSHTTMKHIDSFIHRYMCDYDYMDKHTWVMMEDSDIIYDEETGEVVYN